MTDATQAILDAAGPTDLEQITTLAMRAVDLERAAEGLEAELENVRAELSKLRNNELPDAMSAVGMTEFKLQDGSAIKISNYVSGSLPKDPERRMAAQALLEANGGADLFKTTVSVEFGRKEHNHARALYDDLIQDNYPAQIETTVHSSTLAAFVREKVREGSTMDYEALGVFVGRIAKITLA